MSKNAQCSCGTLRVKTTGDPVAVVVCHCNECQRRTGTVLGVGAYYPRSQVMVSGAAKNYERSTDAGNRFVSWFCPECGSTVYFESGKHPGMIGVSVGAFADPTFPAPQRSVWERSMHSWIGIAPGVQHFSKGREE